MQKQSLLIGAVLFSAVAGISQTIQNCGFYFNCSTGATSRGGTSGANTVEILGRFDFDDYRGYGHPQPSGGSLVNGFTTVTQDQDGATVESFNIHVYGQDPANDNYPNFVPGSPIGTNALVTMGPFTPAATTGIAAWGWTINFATPLSIPNDTGDVFIGVELPGNAGWSATDGTSVHINLGIQPGPTFTVYDLKGAAAIGQTSYGAAHDPANANIPYGGTRQINFDFLSDYVGGVATAITSQGTYTISNTAPGTASFMSGLHPDAASPAFNSGRADDIGYVYTDVNMGAGTNVVFQTVDFNFGPFSLPLSQFVPGAQGIICQSLNLSVLGFQLATSTQVNFVTTIPAAARSFLGAAGLQGLVFSAIAVNLNSGAMKGAPCAHIHF